MSSNTDERLALAAVTALADDQFRVTWKFVNCSIAKSQTSPTFSLSSKDDSIKFYIEISPVTGKLGNAGVYVFIRFGNFEPNLTVEHQMSFIDATGNRRFTNEGISRNSFTTGTLYIDKNYLFDTDSGLLKDDTLEIYCEMKIVKGQMVDESANYKHQALTSLSKAMQDYDSLLESSNFWDVVLVVGNDSAKKQFHAHKTILSARSPVFGAMFEDNTEETDRVIIKDVLPDVFGKFIRYLYTGMATEMDKYASDLLFVAFKFQMDCLTSLCAEYLALKLTTESAASILGLAERYIVPELKSKCIDFIVEHASAVMATDGWRDIKYNPNLMVELFKKSIKEK